MLDPLPSKHVLGAGRAASAMRSGGAGVREAGVREAGDSEAQSVAAERQGAMLRVGTPCLTADVTQEQEKVIG